MVDMKSVLGEFYMILYPIVSAEVVPSCPNLLRVNFYAHGEERCM